MRSSLHWGLGASILSLTAVASARPDLNSFVNRKVATPQGLASQIKADPVVADRYQRHFSMSKSEVVAYVMTLHRDTLDREGVYTVYSVPKGGRLKMHSEKLKKGEPIFADVADRPIMVIKCGNPLTLGPSRSNRGNTSVWKPNGERGLRIVDVETPETVAFEAPYELVAMMPPVPPPTNVGPPVDPPIVVPPETIATVPASAVGGGGGRFPWFAGLPLLIPIIGSIDRGGGGGDSVPEPATMVALGAGVAVLARRRKASR